MICQHMFCRTLDVVLWFQALWCHTKKVQGLSLHVLTVCMWVLSTVLIRSKGMHVRLTGGLVCGLWYEHKWVSVSVCWPYTRLVTCPDNATVFYGSWMGICLTCGPVLREWILPLMSYEKYGMKISSTPLVEMQTQTEFSQWYYTWLRIFGFTGPSDLLSWIFSPVCNLVYLSAFSPFPFMKNGF